MKTKAQVFYKDILAGELYETLEGEYYFSYSQEYLESKHPAISYSLPKTQQEHFSRVLHGFFDGLLPEGWLLKLAGDLYKLNPMANRYELLLKTCLDPVGAVSIHPLEGCSNEIESKAFLKPLEAQRLERLEKSFGKCLYCYDPLSEGLYHTACAKKLIKNCEAFPVINLDQALLREIERMNISDHVSIPGVQHKISLDSVSNGKDSRLTVTNYAGKFILKPRTSVPHIPENEHLVMKLAKVFGIETATSSLVLLQNGDLAMLSRRFDRNRKNQKVHMEDFAQILDQLTIKKYISSIEKVGKHLKTYCADNAPMDQVLRLFELVVFSYVVGNSDLHLKNISVLMDPLPRLSPADDLLSFEIYQEDYPERDPDDSALAINGKKGKFKKDDFDKLAEALGLKSKVRDYVYQRLKKTLPEFEELIRKSFLPINKQALLNQLILDRAGELTPDR